MTIQSDFDTVAVGPFSVVNVDLFASRTEAPASVFVDLGFGGDSEAVATVDATSRTVGSTAAAIAVEGPETTFNGITWAAIKGDKEGIAIEALAM